MRQLPDVSQLSDAEKDALIRALFQWLEATERRIAELEAKLGDPPKTPDNSSLPPSKGQKPNQPEKAGQSGPRQGSLGRKGGGCPLACDPDETVIANSVACGHCQAALGEADQVLHGRYDRIDMPVVRPVVTRMERYAGHYPCCGGATLAPVPEGMGGRLAVQREHPGTCDLPALHPCRRLPSSDTVVPALVCLADQRGRTGCDVSACQALLRQRGDGDPRRAAPLTGHLLRRDLGADRREIHRPRRIAVVWG